MNGYCNTGVSTQKDNFDMVDKKQRNKNEIHLTIFTLKFNNFN